MGSKRTYKKSKSKPKKVTDKNYVTGVMFKSGV